MGKRRTNSEFLQEVYELVRDDYTFLEDFKGVDFNILVRHNTCGNEYKVRPAGFLKGSRCPPCSFIARGKKQRRSHEEFCEEVYNLVGDDYLVLSKYKLSGEKVKFKHIECGYEFEMLPGNFLHQGQRCPECGQISSAKSQTRTQEEFCQEIFDLVGDEYTVLGKYELSKIPVLIRHNICGHTYKVSAGNFIHNSRRCPECAKINAGLKRRVTRDEFESRLYEVFKGEYTVKEFKSMREKVLVVHNVCKKSHWYGAHDILSGGSCVYCGKLWLKTHDYFIDEVYELVGDEYTVLSEYLGANEYVSMKHNRCGHKYDVWPANFLFGKRCPQCFESRGEKAVRKYLDAYNIRYEMEYSFQDLVGAGGGLLRFDFAIFDKECQLSSLIEYDGEFHYKDIHRDGRFELQQFHDNAKDQYCKDSNIPLLRIPYWDFSNIESILNRNLIK